MVTVFEGQDTIARVNRCCDLIVATVARDARCSLRIRVLSFLRSMFLIRSKLMGLSFCRFFFVALGFDGQDTIARVI